MKLINEIVDSLSNENESLNQALLKTKVLLHRLGQKELATWVNDELTGYGDGKEVPSYRVVQAEVMGDIANPGWRRSGILLPIRHLPQHVRHSFEQEKLRQALSVLKQFAHNKNEAALICQIPPEFNAQLGKTLGNDYFVESAWAQIACSSIVQVLTEIRSRLLNFILELQGKLGEDVTEINFKAEAAKFDTQAMFASSIFGGSPTFGDNTTLILGHGNSQQVTNTIISGDFGSLAKELRAAGVADADVSALKMAIDTDVGASELNERKFGPAVRSWMHGMIGKAINLAWQIEVSVAAGLLTSSLQFFYFS